MTRDFFDDDLEGSDLSGEGPRDESSDVPVSTLSDAGLARMVKQKEEIATQVADAMGEIERLRKRQEDLEKERSGLESLGRKQEEYEQGKRDMIAKLGRSIILLEKEEAQAVRMGELLAATRSRFQESLTELSNIVEENWSNEDFENELNKGLVIVNEARRNYKKGLARIEASSWHKGVAGANGAPVFDRVTRELHAERNFASWLREGIAVSLPLIAVIVALFVFYLYWMGVV
jgi:hypothetical protein